MSIYISYVSNGYLNITKETSTFCESQGHFFSTVIGLVLLFIIVGTIDNKAQFT